VNTQRALLLSLRPRFATAILNGTKTVEVRRRPVNAPPGSRVILYASAPVMAIVGTARLRDIEVTDPDNGWNQHHLKLGLSRSEFDTYLEDANAHLLHLTDPSWLNEPLPLAELRQGGFHPPQSFRYIAPSDPPQLRKLTRS
jgi:predicted transcriptional regulator